MSARKSSVKTVAQNTLVRVLAIVVSFGLTMTAVGLGWPFWAVLTVLVVSGLGLGVLSGLYIAKRR